MMQSLALQLLVVAMMLAVGLELTTSDLANAPKRSRWFVLALVVNLVFVPLGAWVLAESLPISPGWVAGIVLLAAAPGGPVGPVLGRLADADLAFSTGLMVLLGVFGLVSAPLTVAVLLDTGTGDGLFWPMFRALLVFQILPLAAAMAVRRLAPAPAKRMVRPARLVSNLLLATIVIALVIVRGRALVEVSATVHLALVGSLSLILAPALFRLPDADGAIVRGLAVVSAVRNISVALLLAAAFFDDPDVEVAILICSFWMLVLPVLFGLAARRSTVGRVGTSEAIGDRLDSYDKYGHRH